MKQIQKRTHHIKSRLENYPHRQLSHLLAKLSPEVCVDSVVTDGQTDLPREQAAEADGNAHSTVRITQHAWI